MDKTVFEEQLLVDSNLRECLSRRSLACFLYSRCFLIPDYVVSALFRPIRPTCNLSGKESATFLNDHISHLFPWLPQSSKAQSPKVSGH